MTGTQPACRACGALHEPGQEFCLECGSRIVQARGPFAALGRAWERRLGRYPGDWVWTSLLALGVAAGGAAAAIVATEDGRSGGPETIVATTTFLPAPAPAPAATTARAGPATTAPPPRPPGLAKWPARNGYTVVLSSIPARGPGLDEAKGKAKQALAAGLTPAGILLSSNFSSLHPGYYVVFAGIYDSLEEAQAAVSGAAGKFPNAYARQIAR